MLLYGSGLRINEALRLRVKDIDFEMQQLIIRSGKINKDRVTLLPNILISRLLYKKIKSCRLIVAVLFPLRFHILLLAVYCLPIVARH